MTTGRTDDAAKESDTSSAAQQAERDLRRRWQIDRSCRWPVATMYVTSVFWLLFGSVLAILASVKLHTPGFLASWEFLTFGRVRPTHLNTMVYGWASLSGMGTLLWLQARLSKVPLYGAKLLTAVALLWNLNVSIGTIAILAGEGTSVEWLEFPWYVGAGFTVLFVPVMVLSALTFMRRRVRHVYVSQWYLFGAIFWFPILYVLSHVMIHLGMASGVAQATTNWWYAHNVLGIWFTPIGLATAYYLIPKVIGRPVHSYYLSLLGFWTLALFYNWAGTHHLIGGPLPVWITSVGTVASMMMFIPVITVAINHHMTMTGHFGKLRTSPTLRFVVFAAMSYTLVSVQGSTQALRVINEVSHFTHYTVAHAHLGMYAFVTMMSFGAMYYVFPRLMDKEWSSGPLIRIHFWTTAIGVVLYWVGLTIGGWIQGTLMLDPDVPFLDIVARTIPYLWSRSVAAGLMTIGHVAFAVLVFRMVFVSDAPIGPTLFPSPRSDEEDA